MYPKDIEEMWDSLNANVGGEVDYAGGMGGS